MRTDRQTDSGSFGGSVLLLTIALICYAGGIGFAAVWLRHEISVTANNIKVLEQKIADVQRRVDEAAAEVAEARSPENLIRLNQELGLNLVQPDERQVIRITENVERRLAAKRFDRLFTSTPTPPDGGRTRQR
ncbi:MAG: hypothetical protein D6781_12480 [Verrucomicrobia bacterium]|nr:MAG: hypothetical protein D6781_12480 [Verrucomicrobiota bacterium]